MISPALVLTKSVFLTVTLSVALAVFASVMVPALGNWNAPVKVFDTPDRHGSTSF